MGGLGCLHFLQAAKRVWEPRKKNPYGLVVCVLVFNARWLVQSLLPERPVSFLGKKVLWSWPVLLGFDGWGLFCDLDMGCTARAMCHGT